MRNGAPTQDDPSNRWPWIAVLAGVLVIAVAVAIFFLNRSNSVNVTIEGTPSPKPVAGAASSSPPATLVPPTLQPSASLVPSPTAVPSPTPQATPTARPTLPPPPTAVQVVVATAPPPAQAPAAAQASPGATVSGVGTAGTATPAPNTPSAPAPTAFTGQVASGGGLGNTRSDLDAAYGAPVGETPNHLVVYRKNNFEYHVQLAPDPNGRAALIAISPQNAQPLALEQAQAEAHRLLPRDAQPPTPRPEGNAQFVVERFTSDSLAQALALPSSDFLVVYARDAQGRITRFVLGPGDDPNAVLASGS